MPGSDTTAVGPRTRTSSSLSKTHSTKRAPTRRSSTEPEDSAPPAYSLSPKDVATRFEVDVDCGLSEEQVQDRKARYGPNQLEGAEGVSWVRVLVGQIVNAMVLVLVAACIVSLAIKSWIEGGVIAGVVLVNITVGFMQQYSAEKTMDSLRSLASPSAAVIRDSHNQTIAAGDLVPGDIVELKTGDVIPADLRLIEAMNFEADEALLTGESLPVLKDPQATFSASEPIGVGDQTTMAFASSTVTKGRAKGIVTGTGMKTEIGSIAASLQGKGNSRIRKVRRSEQGKKLFHYYIEAAALTTTDAIGRFLGVNVGTPLQRRLSQLAVGLFVLAVVMAVIVEAANFFTAQREVIIYAVSTGLSMIPASLVVVLTITFAIGTKRMVSRNVIVRKLDALEALGAVTDVCSDKTGTLTQGRMVVRRAWIPNFGSWSLHETSDPFNPHDGRLAFASRSPAETSQTDSEKGSAEQETTVDLGKVDGPLEGLLDCAALCNLASVFEEHHKEEDGEKTSIEKKWAATGDPTEIAIQVFAHRFHRGRAVLQSRGWNQLAEYPFSSDLKRMSVIYSSSSSEKASRMAFMKGAVERVLDACVEMQSGEKRKSIEDEDREELMKNVESMAAQGLRVLALASRTWEGQVEGVDRAEVENGMTLLGLVGIYDPPRPESKESVESCQRAGIVVHMLTGDHAATATAIAKEIGIIPDVDIARLPKHTVVTAAEFDALSDDQVDQLDELPKVIGRCSPETKVRMIEALHRRKRFAAMTGDGVNDSPSLSRADVGIAMGTGSDVAKSASDIVLTDDNFASILAAIEEGRRSFDNIQKFILHLLATNVAQAFVLLLGLVFKDQQELSVFPLSPVEVLWLVVMTAGPPAMGLGMEVAAADIMDRPPHDANVGVFTAEVFLDMAVFGLFAGAISFCSFFLVVYGFKDGDLGEGGCNESRAGCETVFRARATCFAVTCWIVLLLAWQLVNTRRSFFRMQPKTKTPFTQFARDVWRNQVLFWSVMAGLVLIFPIIYIPVINDVVFLHAPISWEWAIVFIGALIFMIIAELWKWAKRAFIRAHRRRQAKKAGKSGSVPAGGSTHGEEA